jgi:hypothetical protein
MNKKGITSLDILELIKIGILIVVGVFLISSLISILFLN